MPADMPLVAPIVAVPYYRVIAFLVGGGATLAVLLLLTSLIARAA